jgi:hypothetical protein
LFRSGICIGWHRRESQESARAFSSACNGWRGPGPLVTGEDRTMDGTVNLRRHLLLAIENGLLSCPWYFRQSYRDAEGR